MEYGEILNVMEDNINNPDLGSVITELQILNQSINSENQKIDKYLEYWIAKDKEEKQKEETQKKIDEQEQIKQAELKEQEEKEMESAEAEQTAKADAQTETYTELLTDIRDQVQLTNQLLSVDVLIFGIVIGLLLIKTFIDRMVK